MTEVIISLQLCLWSLALPRCQWEGCSTPFRQKVADNIISFFLFCYCRTLPLEKCFLKIAVLKFQEFFLPFWNNYFKKHFWMAGSRKNLKLFSATKNKLKKMKKKKKIIGKVLKLYLSRRWMSVYCSNYQQRNVFTSNRGSNDKISSKLAVV